jgi:hypothetical protein
MQQEWVLDALVLFEQNILLEVGNRGCILCTTLQKDAGGMRMAVMHA